jgi:hypothetical protein
MDDLLEPRIPILLLSIPTPRLSCLSGGAGWGGGLSRVVASGFGFDATTMPDRQRTNKMNDAYFHSLSLVP